MTVRVELDTRKLDRLLRESPGKADKVVREWATIIAGDAAKGAPVATGALRASILANSPEKRGPMKYRIQDGVEYGIWQEIGTKHMTGHPFLIPAVERHWQSFLRAFEGLFK